MEKQVEINYLAKDIQSTLITLESTFFEIFVSPGYNGEEILEDNLFWQSMIQDNETYLFHTTRELYYKICLFLELRNVPMYYKMFTDKFSIIIDNKTKVLKSRGPLYNDSEPSMIIHDDLREFLSVFHEFDNEILKKVETNKLKLILENTHSIIDNTKTIITNEASIYKPVKWVVEMIYPNTRELGKARFIKKFTTYHPDILIPEISSAVEYKYIRKGENIETFLDQIKTDADNYEGDPEFRFFYAVVYFQEKSQLNPEAFKRSIIEKKFPENWTIIAL